MPLPRPASDERVAEVHSDLKKVFGVDSLGVAKWIADLTVERDQLRADCHRLAERIRNHEQND